WRGCNMSNESQVTQAPVNFGANLGYILDLYDLYLNDPASVPEDLQVLFSTIKNGEANIATNTAEGQQNATKADSTIKRVMRLIDNIRQYGHLLADIYPVNKPVRENLHKLNIEDYNLDRETLESMSAVIVYEHCKDIYDNDYEAIVRMEKRYKGPIAFEYTHINNNRERVWLKRRIETPYKATLNDNQKIELFKNLAHVEGFEKYLHKNFVGAKRFSIEGVDTLVPMLQQTLRLASDEGIQNIQIGMAHRGRLNVLTHVLEKPYQMMISEFMHTDPMKFLPKDGSLELTSGWSGDVKYHLGGVKTTNSYGSEQRISLANNPSHLAIVTLIRIGKTSANRNVILKIKSVHPDLHESWVLLINVDAANPGKGITFEDMNLEKLDGYSTGCTLHIIANNRICFTTEPED